MQRIPAATAVSFLNMKKILIAALSFFTGTVSASEIKDVTITRTMMDNSYGSVVFIQVDGDPVRENCHDNATWDYVLATGTDLGKQMLTQVIASHASQKSLKLFGDETCPIGSTENLKRIEVY